MIDKSDIEIIKGLHRKGYPDYDIAVKMGMTVKEVAMVTVELTRAAAVKESRA